MRQAVFGNYTQNPALRVRGPGDPRLAQADLHGLRPPRQDRREPGAVGLRTAAIDGEAADDAAHARGLLPGEPKAGRRPTSPTPTRSPKITTWWRGAIAVAARHSASALGHAGPPNDLGIYLFDAFGNLNLIYRDPAISSMEPLPIRPRRNPPQIASRVNVHESSDSRLLVADVYQGLSGIPRGTIKQLRLVGVPAKTHPTMNSPNMGITLDDPGKFVIGSVPVEEDGSAYFRVPAGVAFFFQALDDQGMAVQTMRSATYLQPGQTASCIGCHEPRNTAPANARPRSALRDPSKITACAPGAWPVDYGELVQPVLDAQCVSCHQPGAEGALFDLTAEHSYDALIGYGSPSLQEHVRLRYQEGRSTAAPARLAPTRCGSCLTRATMMSDWMTRKDPGLSSGWILTVSVPERSTSVRLTSCGCCGNASPR